MKKLALIVVAVLILIGGGWYFFSQKNKVEMQPQQEAVKQDVSPLPPTEDSSGVISSIKDAMGLGKKMVCTYTSTGDTPVTSTVFIDGQKIKTATVVNGKTMYGLFDGDTQYSWGFDEQKQGFKMTKSCMEEIKNLAPKSTTETAPTPAPIQDSTAFDNAQNVNCTPANTEDFSLPTDVTFIDQCEMLKNSMKGLDQMKKQLPNGINLPEGVKVPEQY